MPSAGRDLWERKSQPTGNSRSLPNRRYFLHKCDPFGIPSTSHCTGAAIKSRRHAVESLQQADALHFGGIAAAAGGSRA
jgi:hypothetical protein